MSARSTFLRRWFLATHKLWVGETWFVLLGSDIFHPHYGLTVAWGGWKPSHYPEGWKDWHHKWRLNVRWPITIHRVN